MPDIPGICKRLKDAREDCDIDIDAVCALMYELTESGFEPDRLAEIESGSNPSRGELDVLDQLYRQLPTRRHIRGGTRSCRLP